MGRLLWASAVAGVGLGMAGSLAAAHWGWAAWRKSALLRCLLEAGTSVESRREAFLLLPALLRPADLASAPWLGPAVVRWLRPETPPALHLPALRLYQYLGGCYAQLGLPGLLSGRQRGRLCLALLNADEAIPGDEVELRALLAAGMGGGLCADELDHTVLQALADLARRGSDVAAAQAGLEGARFLARLPRGRQLLVLGSGGLAEGLPAQLRLLLAASRHLPVSLRPASPRPLPAVRALLAHLARLLPPASPADAALLRRLLGDAGLRGVVAALAEAAGRRPDARLLFAGAGRELHAFLDAPPRNSHTVLSAHIHFPHH